MKLLPGKEILIIGMLLLLTVVQILDASQVPHASGRKRRQAENYEAGAMNNDLDLTSIKKFLDKIPIVGPIVDTIYNYVSEVVIDLDQLTNNIIPRVLGGSLPCELTTSALTCSGTSKDGSTFAVVKRIIDMLPDTILPEPVKGIILDVLKYVVNPVANTLFGGLPL